jgi:hypothetical protein
MPEFTTKKRVLFFFAIIVLVLVFSWKEKEQEILFEPRFNGTEHELIRSENRTSAFYMGFTPFPYDITSEAVEYTYQFLSEHTDIIAHHFDSGVPWPEAYNKKEYHQKVQDNINTRILHKKGFQETYLALTPLNGYRTNIAGYWAERENQPQKENWENITFTDPRTATAYINFCENMILTFEPKFMAYGIEVNMLADTNPEIFPDYVEFTKQVYTSLKEKHPELSIFLTFQIDYYYGNPETQIPAVKDLLPYTDILAVSTYPFTRYPDPGQIPEDHFSTFASLADEKPFAVAETGFPSDSIRINEVFSVTGTPEWQREYAEFLLTECQLLEAEFIVWFCPIDYDATWNYLIDYGIDPIFKLWIDTGVLDERLEEKPVLELWDNWLNNENNTITRAWIPIFSVSPIDIKNISSIIPLGALSPPSHVFPTDHIYFVLPRSDGADRPHIVSVYSPGDLIITSIRATEHVNAGITDFVFFLKSRKRSEVSVMFIHISSLNDDLFGDISNYRNWAVNAEYSTGDEIYRTWSRSCEIEVSAGDIIGTAGGNPGQWALDLGVYDEKFLPDQVANIDRWSDVRYLHSVCPLDYYVEGTVRESLFSLVQGKEESGIQMMCGSILQDIRGTAQGCWFLEGVDETYPEDPHLALVSSNIDPNQLVLSVGRSIKGLDSRRYEFYPTDLGLINRDFKDITSDGNIYGFEIIGFDGIILLKMHESSTLWIEVLEDPSEPKDWIFTENKTVFVR